MCRLWRPGEGTAPVPHAWRHRGPCRHCGVARAPAKKSRSLRLEVMAAAAPLLVGIAPCDHEGRDHHRVLPAQKSTASPTAWCRWHSSSPPGRPPATCHRAEAAGQPAAPRGPGFRAVPLPSRPRPGRAAARLPELPARPAEPGDAPRAAQAPDRGRSPGQPGHARRVRRGPGRPLGLPAVAVFQTDLPSYAHAYRLGRPGEAVAWRWLRRIHNHAARRWRRPRSPRPACSAAASETCGCGAAGWIRPVRPGPAQYPDPGRAGAGR